MEYGILTDGQLLIHRERQDGDKPIIRTAPPTFAYNESPYFYWEETESEIRQFWGANIIPDMPEEELTAEEIAAAIEEALA